MCAHVYLSHFQRVSSSADGDNYCVDTRSFFLSLHCFLFILRRNLKQSCNRGMIEEKKMFEVNSPSPDCLRSGEGSKKIWFQKIKFNWTFNGRSFSSHQRKQRKKTFHSATTAIPYFCGIFYSWRFLIFSRKCSQLASSKWNFLSSSRAIDDNREDSVYLTFSSGIQMMLFYAFYCLLACCLAVVSSLCVMRR